VEHGGWWVGTKKLNGDRQMEFDGFVFVKRERKKK
jgi:hypothetical protein